MALWILDDIGNFLQKTFGVLGDLFNFIGDFFNKVVDTIKSVIQFITDLYDFVFGFLDFLPSDIRTLLYTTITIVIAIAIMKLFHK